MARILLTFLLVVVGLMATRSGLAARPNVLFIAADDLRCDLGCYGHPLAKTPNIDRLADRGVTFDAAYCQQAVCNPSRASLLTGRRLDRLQIWDLPTHFRMAHPDVVTLPQQFKQAGWFTRDIGKIFHNWRQEIEGDPDSWSVPAEDHYATHGSDKPQVEGTVPANLAEGRNCRLLDVPDDAYFDGRIATKAVAALEDYAQTDQPFFLAVGFWKPHSPFNAPKRYWDLYHPASLPPPTPADWPRNAPRIAWHNGRELVGRGGKPLTPIDVAQMRHGYLAAISYLDAQVGRLLDAVDRLGLAEETVVVFWSDHGYHLGEQTLWAKTSNFELDARVPLIIAAPGRQKVNARVASPVELLDIYPTLIELAGLEAPRGLEGVSLVPLLSDPTAAVKQAALTQHPRPAYFEGAPDAMGYSVRSATHRYTEWRDWKTGETVARELYDHLEDPDETVNIAVDAGQAAVLRRHAMLLEEFRPIVRPDWEPVLP